MTNSTKFGIPYIASQQAQPDVTHNEALYMLEALLHGVIDRTNVPPGAPVDGDTYMITAVASGAWVGKENHIAVWRANEWGFVPGFDTNGVLIPIGAAHEGLAVWVNDENIRYIWSGAAWSTASGIAASGVTFAPAGTIAATDVQAAIAEAADEAVQVAGDTMTGPLAIDVDTTSGLVLKRVSGGGQGPFPELFHDSASPIAADDLGGMLLYGRDSAANKELYAWWGVVVEDPTATSEDSNLHFSTVRAGTLAKRLLIGGGVYGGIALADPGAGNANFADYFDNGVNINTIYAALAGAAFTGRVSVTTATHAGNTPALSEFNLQTNDGGASGPTYTIYFNSPSPANGDTLGRWVWYFNNASAAETFGFQMSVAIPSVTPGAETTQALLLTRQAGTNTVEMTIGGGVAVGGVVQGAGTLNASNSIYVNAILIADTNSLLRLRGLTVGTLPAAGTAGRIAKVSDALAPAWNTALVGGGAVDVGARDNGAAWVAF